MNEQKILGEVFIPWDDYYEMITPYENSIQILVGRKGSGKSALLDFLTIKTEEQKIPVVRMTPENLKYQPKDITSLALISEEIYDKVIFAIANEIGKTVSGYISNDDAVVIDQAIQAGERPALSIDKIIHSLAPIGKALTKIDFEAMLPKYAMKTPEMVRAIKNISEKKYTAFYLLIDDTDHISLPQNKNYLEEIWGFIIAIQKIARMIPNIKPIVSIRSEIWQRLNDDDCGARDQIDHYRLLVKNLHPTDEKMKEIIEKRLKAACKDLGISQRNEFAPFFERVDCKLPSSNERRLWTDYFITSSRFRPRDSIQLINELAQSAIDNQREIIIDFDVDNTAYKYSHERVKDILNENQYLTDQLLVIIKSFKNIPFTNEAKTILRHLDGLPGTAHIEIKRNIMRVSDEDNIFVIWKLLYDIEFLTPKTKDARFPRGFRFIRPHEDTELV